MKSEIKKIEEEIKSKEQEISILEQKLKNLKENQDVLDLVGEYIFVNDTTYMKVHGIHKSELGDDIWCAEGVYIFKDTSLKGISYTLKSKGFVLINDFENVNKITAKAFHLELEKAIKAIGYIR